MMQPKQYLFIAVLLAILILGACNYPGLTPPAGIEALSFATPMPPAPQTLVSFQVTVPANIEVEEGVLLTIMDDVTNLALNTQLYQMEAVESGETITGVQSAHHYTLTIPAAIGSTLKYRYERQVDESRIAEHLSDKNPVHYRLYHVSGQGTVQDIVSCWADTEFDSPSGYIQGKVVNSQTGESAPTMLVSAGGMHTMTDSQGNFILEGLPAGVHNLVAFSLDGSYRTFQQGAQVEAGNITPVEIQIDPVSKVNILFVVKTPEDTPPIVPLRMAGNLIQLGNSFAQLNGGMSGLAENMPVMNRLPDGRYTITLELPVGADIRYKYTLGDGFWNAEHDKDGNFVLRQLIVPKQNTLIEERVETWHDSSNNSLTFDVYVPSETPSEDTISIQFSPLIGWTEPIPMWKLEADRWAYVLYSPLNLPGEFFYRYCRNSQCGKADDIQTPGLYGRGRPLKLSQEPQTVQDGVSMWVDWAGAAVAPATTVPANVRSSGFWAGVEFDSSYHPSWLTYLPDALSDVQQMNANWVVLSPTWTYPNTSAPGYIPKLKIIPGKDATWYELQKTISAAKENNLNVALYPKPDFPKETDTWWLEADRSAEWWQHWFENYYHFIIHNADLAEQNQVSALILGGEWLRPALPAGTLSDGSASGAPEDAEARWRSLFAEIRSHFSGKLLWAIPYENIQQETPFLDALDQIYMLVSQKDLIEPTTGTMVDLDRFIDYNLLPFQILSGKALILTLDYPSDPDLASQSQAYQAFLEAAMARDWIAGFVGRGYYPPVAVQDHSSSIHGKPASELLNLWYYALLGIQ